MKYSPERIRRALLTRVKEFWGSPLKEIAFIRGGGTKARYIGYVGFGNLGDEAIFQATRELFSRQLVFYQEEHDGIGFKLFGSGTGFKAIFLGGGTLIKARSKHLRRLHRIIPRYSSAQLIVFGTGVEKAEFWEQFGFPVDVQAWRQVLDRSAYIGVRGPLSKAVLDEWGLNQPVEVIGDPVCWFAEDNIELKGMNKKIGINIGPADGYIHGGSEKELVKAAGDLLRQLREEGWEITLFPVVRGDIQYLQQAAKLAGIAQPIIFDDYLDVYQTLAELKKQDLFVGQKLHSVILADCVYTPTIMLEYRPKCLDYMLSMDRERWVHRTDGLDASQIYHQIGELYGQLPAQQEQIHQRMAGWKMKLTDAAQKVIAGL